MRQAWNLSSQRDTGMFIVLVIMSVIVMAVDRMGDEGTLTGYLSKAFLPFEVLSSRLMNFSYTHEENEILRARLMDLSKENTYLREQVHETKVAGELGQRMGGGILIDQGGTAGLTKNMTVVSPDGLIGGIVRVARGASQVKRITDPGYKVSAMMQRSRATGILGARTDGRLVMEWVAPDADVARGDTVISSGLGSITPKGIVIGAVTSIEERPEKFSLAVEVEPFADFDRLEEVFVIVREPPNFRALLEDSRR
jgi:rod shape-determining protein MreC